MKRAWSEARKTTTSATSSGSPSRRRGVCSMVAQSRVFQVERLNPGVDARVRNQDVESGQPVSKGFQPGTVTHVGMFDARKGIFGELFAKRVDLILGLADCDHPCPFSAQRARDREADSAGAARDERRPTLEAHDAALARTVANGFRMCSAKSSSCPRSAVIVCRKISSTPASTRSWIRR